MSREEMIDEAVRRYGISQGGVRAVLALLDRSPLHTYLCIRAIGNEFRAVCREQGVAHE